MKLTHFIYISAALAMLTACHDDATNEDPFYTVGEVDNAIVLTAGVREGGSGVLTRAVDDHHAPSANGGGHSLIVTGAKMLLRVDGIWVGKSDISKTTTITIGDNAATTGNGLLHNAISNYDPTLFWDDYGTADPANQGDASKGREKGLTIHGIGVNKSGVNAPEITGATGKAWSDLAWNVGTPSGSPLTIDQRSDWTQYDLITSNNIKDGKDGTYKFDDWKNKTTPSNLLEFTHALTKITVNLTAAEGFPAAGEPAQPQFQTEPAVTLFGFNYIGKVNVEDKVTTATKSDYTTGADVANINMHREGETWAKTNQVTFSALVFPGNIFSATIADDINKTPSSTIDILELNADGNIYKVTAAQLVKAIVGTTITENPVNATLEEGKNYILNITVRKTSIDVTATVTDWVNVTAANEAPIIRVNNCYGGTGTNFGKAFNFYRSTSLDGSFMLTDNTAIISYADSKYTMAPQLYWPNHSTHYFFRGIWPLVGSHDGNSQKLGPVDEDFIGGKQITVANEAYRNGYYPSDLMIGMPRKEDGSSDEFCKAGHTTGENPTPGICATDAPAGSTHPYEGLIHMNFQYAMSQVVVNLETSTGGDRVTFNEHTKVEIVGGLTCAALNLSDGSTDLENEFTAIRELYLMHKEDGSNIKYHDAIVPQPLATVGGDPILKFRITVGNGSESDVYETVLGISNIKEQSTGNAIHSWEPGKKYVYTLYITKTDIVAVATIKDWVTVNASENVWF